VPNATIALDMVNVLGAPLRRYREFNDMGDEFARQIIYLERTYSPGVRFRFRPGWAESAGATARFPWAGPAGPNASNSASSSCRRITLPMSLRMRAESECA